MDDPTRRRETQGDVAHGRRSGSKGAAGGRPKAWARLGDQYRDVAAAYEALAAATRAAGPLDGQSVALVKIAVSIGSRSCRTVHAHAKKALEAGVAPDALRQVALVALPTVGLPAALDALRWIDEIIDEAKPGFDPGLPV